VGNAAYTHIDTVSCLNSSRGEKRGVQIARTSRPSIVQVLPEYGSREMRDKAIETSALSLNGAKGDSRFSGRKQFATLAICIRVLALSTRKSASPIEQGAMLRIESRVNTLYPRYFCRHTENLVPYTVPREIIFLSLQLEQEITAISDSNDVTNLSNIPTSRCLCPLAEA